ncbi:MAG: hypothetical protein ACRC5T_12490 [Cetobacterium sp.]
MTVKEPYFMTNEKWYKFDENERKLVLTKEATKEAKKSYEEFYRVSEDRNYDEFNIEE